MAGKFASSEVPWLRDRLIRRFIAAYDVDMSEAARGVGEFTSFNDFFQKMSFAHQTTNLIINMHCVLCSLISITM